jgi:ribosomal protein S14
MLSRKIKDLNNRKKFKSKEILNLSLKFLYTNFSNKNACALKLSEVSNIQRKNFSKTKIVRRCILNNRSRGSVRPFNVSRIKLREMFSFGVMPGYKKAVW